MKRSIKTMKPGELLASFMTAGQKRNEVFKQGHELFYISKLEDLTEISITPVPPVKSFAHSLFFLQKGLLSMKIGSYSIKLQPDECAVIPAGEVFSYSNDDQNKSENTEGFICGFHDDFLLGRIGNRDLLKSFEFLTVWGNPIIQLKKESATFLSNSLGRVLAEYAIRGLQNKVLLQAHLIALLCDLNLEYVPLSDHSNKRAVELTNRFKEHLHKKINFTHKVSDYADMLHISPNHLNKSVKLITNKTPSEWIRNTLINESKVLIFQTDLTIQQIAFELGIDDPSYFTRIFKKQEGVTPAAYRKMIVLY